MTRKRFSITSWLFECIRYIDFFTYCIKFVFYTKSGNFQSWAYTFEKSIPNQFLIQLRISSTNIFDESRWCQSKTVFLDNQLNFTEGTIIRSLRFIFYAKQSAPLISSDWQEISRDTHIEHHWNSNSMEWNLDEIYSRIELLCKANHSRNFTI